MAINPNALTTLVNAKSHLSIKPDDNTMNTRVELFINAASQRIETYTARKLVDQGTITELQHGRSTNLILLKEFPVIAITELRIDDGTHLFTAAETLVAATQYSVGDDRNCLIANTGIFPNGYNNVRVQYRAGYVTVPADLELACLWFVEWFYRHRDRADMGRTTSSKGDESVGILDAAPRMIMEILGDYKRTEMAFTSAPTRNY